MAQIVFFASAFSVLGLPMLAMLALLVAKLSTGTAARRAERRFLALLIVMSLVTAHTVMTQNAAWLIHTTTLSLMVVCSLWIPGQSHASSGDSQYFAGS
ncbi:hypothetical protein SAMN06265222_1196 [Neorhodopirellula lusitana]|uniref:Uncharacterized protein n=1 Tax=Neorhodopirellula lusitana TaxID=445327 RepID=A0ABY1QM37_9BACT|nr:hypothetical protein [Neorhodopirellula lusitana]SMP75298.1 hypothetical protein SAMN06265222_1196 [Neorhodopirellula lusitana]